MGDPWEQRQIGTKQGDPHEVHIINHGHPRRERSVIRTQPR